MVVLDKTLTVPEDPNPTWGVTKRKHTLKDFDWTIGMGLVLVAVLIVSFYPPVSTISMGDDRYLAELGYMFLFFIGLPFLVILNCAIARPKEEAQFEAREASNKWVQTVLKPYIEKKYGINFYGYPLFGYHFPRGEYNGRTIEVRIHGVKQNRDYSFITSGCPVGHNTYEISKAGIWLEEVIRPASVSYKKLDPVY